VDVLIPAHRLVLALLGGEVVEVRGTSSAGTFRAYRGIPDAVHGMIAWPNTVLVTGPESIVIDPGYQTQGDMLAGALRERGITPDDVTTVLMTHLHSDHMSALPQIGPCDVFVHEDELETVHGRAQRGLLDGVTVHRLAGDLGEVCEGIRWIHTPGHSPGHIAFAIDTAEGVVVVAGDTLGPRPEWFATMDLPEGFPERDAHLAAFRRIRESSPVTVIPGHYPPVDMRSAR
jgi:glyoxylase-like metal-dependent hydrolase (beta-lactamase superfamily II)